MPPSSPVSNPLMPWEIDPTSRPMEVSWDCNCRICVMSMTISMTDSISPAGLRTGDVVQITFILWPDAVTTTSSCSRVSPSANV